MAFPLFPLGKPSSSASCVLCFMTAIKIIFCEITSEHTSIYPSMCLWIICPFFMYYWYRILKRISSFELCFFYFIRRFCLHWLHAVLRYESHLESSISLWVSLLEGKILQGKTKSSGLSTPFAYHRCWVTTAEELFLALNWNTVVLIHLEIC